jgi:hypothetical protein
VIRLEGCGPAVARNRGAAVLAGDLIGFVDADVLVAPDTLARLAAACGPRIVAAWAPVSPRGSLPGALNRYKCLAQSELYHSMGPTPHHLTTMAAVIRREAFEACGGFDEGWGSVSVEDVELGRALCAAGGRIAMVEEAGVAHLHRYSLPEILRNDFHKVRRHARTTLAHREHDHPATRLAGQGERRQLRYLVGAPLGAGALLGAALGAWPCAGGLLLGLALWERDLVRWMAAAEGPGFALAALPLMALERTTVLAAAAAGAVDHLLDGGREARGRGGARQATQHTSRCV